MPICLPAISHSSLPSSLINTGIVVQGWGTDENEDEGKSVTQMMCLFEAKKSAIINSQTM